MKTKMVMLLVLLLFTVPVSQAAALKETPHLDVMFLQGGQALVMQSDGTDRVVLDVEGKQFDINFPGDNLNVCAWTNESIFEKAKVGSDTMQDFSSCLLMYKSLSMSSDASYLWLSEGAGFSLNESHGARKLSEKRAVYRVTHLAEEASDSGDVPLSGFKGDVFMALWIDKNKNQVIDAGELEQVVLRFK